MSKFIVFNTYLSEVVDVFDTHGEVIAAIKTEIDNGQGAAKDFEIYQISATFSYVPPTDKGQLVRKDS